MSDPETGRDASTPPAPEVRRPRRWVAVLLGFSLAANLLVVGVIVGTLGWRGGGGPMVRSAPVEVSLFPYTEALDRADRDQMRRDWLRRGPPPRTVIEERRAEAAELAAALRAEPFDATVVEALLQTRARRLAERQDLAFEVLRARILSLEADARQSYADRLEAASERPARRSPRPGSDTERRGGERDR